MNDSLPIERFVPDISRALSDHGRAVVTAEPGAGKTTLVPLRLYRNTFLQGQSIIMLEPRRLAARMAASRMAHLLNEPVGKTVGYQIRNDTIVSSETRIQVVTEGILTRRIQSDPMLSGIGLVIFDEFHERNLVSDLGLALCLDVGDALRDDLRILVMSATLDPGPLSRLMGNIPVIDCPGRQFPVETRYATPRPGMDYSRFSEKHCADTIMEAMSHEPGDILVFLPGAGEIGRVHALLEDRISDPHVHIRPLYANLSKQDQDQAVRPSEPKKRKIVLATSIAETSLTIEGIRIVIDSGLMRIPRFFSGTGMSRLDTVPVSRAGADQRRGRAGRLEQGVCYRLWPQESMGLRPEFSSPEIMQADLSGLLMELALWGVHDPSQLKWLDAPPPSAWNQARHLLIDLSILDSDGKITAHGKTLGQYGLHPRLAHMVSFGHEKNMGYQACLVAALLQDGDILSHKQDRESDIRIRLEIIEAMRNNKPIPPVGFPVNKGRVKSILNNARVLAKRLGTSPGSIRMDDTGRLLAQAYPERIARQKTGAFGSFKLASGMAAYVNETDPLGHYPMIACADLDGRASRNKIFLAAPFDSTWLDMDFKHRLDSRLHVYWDKNTVVSVRRNTYGKLTLSESQESADDEVLISDIMVRMIRDKGLAVLPWTQSLRQLQSRIVFLRHVAEFQDLPDLSDQALSDGLGDWLGPYLAGVRSLKQLARIDLSGALLSGLTWNQRQIVDLHAPTHITVPSGSRIPLDYTPTENPPVLAARIQEMFGMMETPRVAGGRVPLTIHLLTPAGRPAQITQDLESFWKSRYDQIKKELKGRYPKHYWPDDPLTARATNKTKKKMDA